jgi:hypothetical protein
LKIKKGRSTMQLGTEQLQTLHGPPTTLFSMHDVRTHLSVRHLGNYFTWQGSRMRVCFHNLLNCNQDTFALHWHEGSQGDRSRKRSWFTLTTHCFFRRASKAKTKEAKISPTSGKSRRRQVPASWESSDCFFIYVEPLSARISMRWH